MKRKTIGENPLDALIPMQREEEPREERTTTPAHTRSEPSAAPKAKRIERERLTVHLPLEVIERAKNAVYWSPGLTLAGLAETAFLKAIEKLEKDNGGPFTKRKTELKGGRPMK
jgi:hypothetical protein